MSEPQIWTRPVLYCVVPPDLADEFHEPLRRHFRDDSGVQVIVDWRSGDRRTDADRPGLRGGAVATDRRARRERRAELMPHEGIELHPGLREEAVERVRFVQRRRPVSRIGEELDADQLIARFQEGDEEAFSELYWRYYPRVYAQLKVTLRRRRDAREIAQEAFARAYDRLCTGSHGARSFELWLGDIASECAAESRHPRG
jgi:hypothetical protein